MALPVPLVESASVERCAQYSLVAPQDVAVDCAAAVVAAAVVAAAAVDDGNCCCY